MAQQSFHQRASGTGAGASARQIIASRGVVTHFQPILSARQKSVTGLEALSRGIIGVEALSRGSVAAHAASPTGQADHQLISPAQLFSMADREGCRAELERLCRETAVRAFSRLDSRHEDLILFLNFDAGATADDGPGAATLLDTCRRWGVAPNRVAVEVLESKFEDTARLRDMLAQFRECGFLLVLDDVGTGHSNLDRIPLIKPDILKVDRSLISGIDRDYHKQETLKCLVHLARKNGALVVAEGIETQGEAIVSLELGSDLLQGFFLGRPGRGASDSVEEATRRVDQLARDYKAYMVAKINGRKLQHRRFSIVLNEILCEMAVADVAQFDAVLGRVVRRFPRVECVYVLDEAGHQVTETVCNPDVEARSGGVMFRPAPKGADHSLKEYYYILLDVELHKFTTDPYVSLASGNVCRTISTVFRDASNNKMYILCVDVLCEG